MIVENTQAAETERERIGRVFAKQQGNCLAIANSSFQQRRDRLARLHNAILAHRQAIRDALYADFRKHPSEVDLTEIYPVTGEIKHARKHLRGWMRPQRVSVPLSLIGSSAYIRYEPKGMVLIQTPWNFPINLTLGPLVGAIAAGNAVIIKPSEKTPHATTIMQEILQSAFDEDEVAVFSGGVETATALLKLPFNHIYFTGSTKVGKIVMAAAAEQLASVTLELGGKSPTIIDQTADIQIASKRVAWGKFVNSGQICIAPDYVYVHQDKRDEFLKALKGNIKKLYGSNPRESSSYCRMVDDGQFQRVRSMLQDAVQRNAQVELGKDADESQRYIAPTVLTDVSPESELMRQEIFGPVLPVYTFGDLSEPVASIQSKEKPLALYVYSRSKKNIEYVIRNTRAGGTCVNNNCLHFFNHNLPFGGVNHSGIGKGHGRFGFEAFSNARAEYRQIMPWSAIELMMPPYTDFKQKLIDLTIKWI